MKISTTFFIVDQEDGIDDYNYQKYPAIKIARMAVDEKLSGAGVGRYLLLAAVGKVHHLSLEVGCRYITVDSKREAVGFYEKNGFKIIKKDEAVALVNSDPPALTPSFRRHPPNPDAPFLASCASRNPAPAQPARPSARTLGCRSSPNAIPTHWQSNESGQHNLLPKYQAVSLKGRPGQFDLPYPYPLFRFQVSPQK